MSVWEMGGCERVTERERESVLVRVGGKEVVELGKRREEGERKVARLNPV
jgi:hypothetical protein